MEFNPTALKCWKKGGALYAYLRIKEDKKITLKEVFVRFYHNQRKNKK